MTGGSVTAGQSALRMLPVPGRAALLLDMDGTLLDLAPTPDSVVVPDFLPGVLRRLRGQLGDALAFVTGRPIEQVEGLFGDIPFAIAGEHGGAIRHAPGSMVTRVSLPDPPVHWVLEAAGLVAAWPGAMLEQKQRGFVLHYRAIPEAGPALRQGALALVAEDPAGFQLMEASMAWEVRPRGADKGSAVEAVMTELPFAGRAPIFIGDDVTDLDGIAAAQRLDGAGLLVPEVFGSAGGVRDWLARSADLIDAGGTWADR